MTALPRLCPVFSTLLRQPAGPGNDLPIAEDGKQNQGTPAEVRLLPNPGAEATGRGTWRQEKLAQGTRTGRTRSRGTAALADPVQPHSTGTE